MIAAIVRGAAAIVGEREACVALGVSRSSYRRWATPACTHPTRPRSGGRALSTEEREHVLATMHEPRFADLPVPQIYAMLLAEGVHLCSPRTMYRILDAVGENVERRNVTKTHSRPYQSNDNPYSESGFKTMKYRPDFPDTFGCIEHARASVRDFVSWYNHEHHHSGLAMLTPHDVHYGLVDEKIAVRAAALREAYERNPERFPHGPPTVKHPPKEVWISKPNNHPDAHPQPEPMAH